MSVSTPTVGTTPAPSYRRTAAALSWVETKLFVREPVALFFTVAFPLILLLFVGSIGGAQDIGEGVRYIDAYMATMVGVVAANVGVMGMSIHIAENRSRGILKRYRLSPMPTSAFFLAQFVTAAVVTAVSLVALAVVTVLIYGRPGDVSWPPFLLATVLALDVTVSIGVLLGGLPHPVRSIQVVSASVFFLLFFSSGAALPRAAFPDWLQQVTAFNPLTQVNELLVAGYTGYGEVHPGVVVALLAFGLTLNLISARTFDWEGRS